jgi:hypothetical protein
MIDWLLVWYEVVLCGLLYAIHEPSTTAITVKASRSKVWIRQVLAYTEPISGYNDPVFDTQPNELDDGDTTKAPSLGMVH